MRDEFSIADLDVVAGKGKVEPLPRPSVVPSPKEKKKEDLVVTTASFEPRVLDALKILAVRQRTTVRHLLREAAQDLLDKHDC